MCMTSYPCRVRHALSKEKKPVPGLTNRLMRAVVLLDQGMQVVDLPQLDCFGKHANGFQVGHGLGIRRVFIHIDHARSGPRGGGVGSSRGLSHQLLDRRAPGTELPVEASALRAKRLATSVSRVGLTRNSSVFPSKSTARERYIQVVRILRYVSSTFHESLQALR